MHWLSFVQYERVKRYIVTIYRELRIKHKILFKSPVVDRRRTQIFLTLYHKKYLSIALERRFRPRLSSPCVPRYSQNITKSNALLQIFRVQRRERE